MFLRDKRRPVNYIFEYGAENKIRRHGACRAISQMKLVHQLGGNMLDRGKGAVILMSSMAGLQGSGYLSVYAATKAFNRVLAESLWYEWKERGDRCENPHSHFHNVLEMA